MTEKKDWILETGCKDTEYVDPMLCEKYAEIVRKYEAGEDLAALNPTIAKRVQEVVPAMLYTQAMHKEALAKSKELHGDGDGSIRIPGNNEEKAIELFWKHNPDGMNPDGKKTPRAIVVALLEKEREMNEGKKYETKRMSRDGKRQLGLVGAMAQWDK
jgi:hypothetical protein